MPLFWRASIRVANKLYSLLKFWRLGRRFSQNTFLRKSLFYISFLGNSLLLIFLDRLLNVNFKFFLELITLDPFYFPIHLFVQLNAFAHSLKLFFSFSLLLMSLMDGLSFGQQRLSQVKLFCLIYLYFGLIITALMRILNAFSGSILGSLLPRDDRSIKVTFIET